MLVIEAVKPIVRYKECSYLHKSARVMDSINFSTHEYELEEYISEWLKKVKPITIGKEFAKRFQYKINFDIERIDTDEAIILTAKSEGIVRKLTINKSKLKEIKAGE